jgi:hypothetical protein
MLFTLSLVVVSFARLALRGQESNRDDTQLERQANSFFEGLMAGDQDAAFDKLLAGTQVATRTETIRDLKDKTDELEPRYGRYRGFERLETRRLGQDVVLLRYVLKCENYPVLWQFAFYRTASTSDTTLPRDNWKLISLKFDTQFEPFAK